MRFKALMIALMVSLVGCATITPYDDIKVGKFTGSVIVVWIGEGGPSGDGLFVFVPDPDDPLTFTRHSSKKVATVIKPETMYTDGGSIPPIAQAFNGFSPWGYAPAYMIHDWLFTARHCLLDEAVNPEYQQLKDVSFADSADILGEAIRTLVEEKKVKKDDFAGSTITGAVASFVARDLWDKKGACKNPRVSAADARKALEAINSPLEDMLTSRQERSRLSAASRRSPSQADALSRSQERVKKSNRSRVVSRVSF